jgi:hypothetical protein
LDPRERGSRLRKGSRYIEEVGVGCAGDRGEAEEELQVVAE